MKFDQEIYDQYKKQIDFYAGVDEVGRGPLAGPVVASCVLVSNINLKFLKELSALGVTDSKKLSHKKRIHILGLLGLNELEAGVKRKIKVFGVTVYFSIEEVSERKIEEINILNASLKAMKGAYQTVSRDIGNRGLLLIDGNKRPTRLPDKLLTQTVVKGDSKSLIIGLASILAKVYRDFYMQELGELFPGHGFEKHAGYPTKMHLEAIKELGPTVHHRRTFKGVKEYV